MTVGATKKVMKDLDVTLQTNGTNETKKQLIKLGNNLVNDANSYINWVVEQVDLYFFNFKYIFKILVLGNR